MTLLSAPPSLSVPEPTRRRRLPRDYIETSTLVLIAFASAYLSRVFDTAGFPSMVNFLHFLTVPLACLFALVSTRTRDPRQLKVTRALLIGMVSLLAVMMASAIINRAGVPNILFSFLLLGEPYILLLALVCIPITSENVTRLHDWVVRINLFHIGLAFVQKYVLRLHTNAGLEDNIQGIFYRSGAGHVVGSSVALCFAAYFLVAAKKTPLLVRFGVVLAALWQVEISDAKQVLLSVFAAWGILQLTYLKSFHSFLRNVVIGGILGSTFWWAIYNIEFLRPFTTWNRPEIYGPDGEATRLKFATFRIVPTHYDNWVDWLVGLGPGHTVGRLGGWMLDAYWDLLEPLGATRHPASGEVWAAVAASWLGDQSSLFSPLFGWAGIWGDLGFLGLAAYLYLGYVTWRYVCVDALGHFFVLHVAVTGLVFSQMEEPSYMLFLALLLGIRWQTHRHQLLGQAKAQPPTAPVPSGRLSPMP